MGEGSAGVNLVAEDEGEWEEDEDEEWWVGTVGVMEARDEEMGESEPEGGTQSITSLCTRKDDSGLEDELEYPLGSHFPGELEGDGWRSPEPPQFSSEEDAEGVQYLVQVLGLEPRETEPVLGRTVWPEGECCSPSPAPKGEAALSKRCQKEEAEEEDGKDQRPGVGADQAGRLVKGDA
jgi:hypothetical protein